MGKPDPPTPPNPVDTARASTSTNVATSIANAFLNNTNQITPNGDINYDVTGNYQWNDPYTGLNVDIPTFTASQTLTPQQQAINDQNTAAKYNLAGMANAQSDRLSQWLANNINISGAPSAGDPSSITGIQAPPTTFGDAGQQQTSVPGGPQLDYGQGANTGGIQGQLGYTPGQVFGFGDAGNVTTNYGPGDFSADRDKVQDSLMARINPQLAVEKNQLTQQLADQGIRYGSAAYTNAMDNYNRQSNDARFSAINQAGTEQQRMMDMAAQRAGFQNAAQQQLFTQQQARGTFYNTAQNAQFGQNLQAGTFANAAQQQQFTEQASKSQMFNAAAGQQFGQNLQAGQFANSAQQNNFAQQAQRGEFAQAGLAAQVAQAQSGFNAQNMARNQFMNEQFAMRNQPINEISSLLSGSQINNPNFVNTPNNQIPTTDVAGLINTRFSQDEQNYQQESQQQQALMGGIFGMLGGMMKSDREEKDDIVKVGSVFATDVDHDDSKRSLPIYQFSYKDDPTSTRHIGPMAQDVEKLDKAAVTTHRGVKYIHPHRVMGNVFSTAAAG